MKSHFFNIFVISLITFSSVFSGKPVFAGDNIAQTLAVQPNGKLFIEVTRGLVKVKGWDKDEISVYGELDDSVKELIFKNKGKKTLIKAASKGQKHWGDSSVIKIYMPYHTKLYFNGVDATFTLSGLKSGIEGRTISGDLIVTKAAKDIRLSSMGGDIKLVHSTGNADLESVGGSVNISGQYQTAKVQTMAGDVVINIAQMMDVEAKTASGDMLISGAVNAKAEVEFKSISGNLIYNAPEDLNAQCELASKFGGKISNTLTHDKVKKVKHQKQMLKFVSGDGSGRLTMHTISGAININKDGK